MSANEWGVVEKVMIILIVIVYAFIAIEIVKP